MQTLFYAVGRSFPPSAAHMLLIQVNEPDEQLQTGRLDTADNLTHLRQLLTSLVHHKLKVINKMHSFLLLSA